MDKKSALGRGLDRIISRQQEAGLGEVIQQIPVERIFRSRLQARREVGDEQVAQLAASIRESGLLQPIIVTPRGEGYELVAGERRLTAYRALGYEKIPAIVRRVGAARQLQMALIENLQREDLNPIEKARAFERLREEFGWTHEQVARRTGLDRSTVSNLLRLLKLPQEAQELVSRETITMGHARALLSISDEAEIVRIARRVAAEGLSVRATEELVRRISRRAQQKRPSASMTEGQLERRSWEERLRRLLGTKVTITGRKNKGKILIEFYSHEQFLSLVQTLQRAAGGS